LRLEDMTQLDLFGKPEPSKPGMATQTGKVTVQNGEYIFIPGFFDLEESDHYFKVLRERVEWKQESMSMYGKKIPFPRLIAWYGNDDKPFSFSGITLQTNPWTKEMPEIKDRIEPIAKVSFNSVLLNL
jgi:alkylated DNA repair dioxygenase AlkB